MRNESHAGLFIQWINEKFSEFFERTENALAVGVYTVQYFIASFHVNTIMHIVQAVRQHPIGLQARAGKKDSGRFTMSQRACAMDKILAVK